MVHLIEWDGERDCPVCEAVMDRQNLIDRAQRAERQIAELRAALDSLVRCSAYREYGHCGQCEQRAQLALKHSTGEGKP